MGSKAPSRVRIPLSPPLFRKPGGFRATGFFCLWWSDQMQTAIGRRRPDLIAATHCHSYSCCRCRASRARIRDRAHAPIATRVGWARRDVRAWLCLSVDKVLTFRTVAMPTGLRDGLERRRRAPCLDRLVRATKLAQLITTRPGFLFPVVDILLRCRRGIRIATPIQQIKQYRHDQQREERAHDQAAYGDHSERR